MGNAARVEDTDGDGDALGDEMLTTTEAGRLLGGYTKDTVRALCERGAFPGAVRLGHCGWWRVPQADVVAYREKSRPKLRTRVLRRDG